jgi:hypothetical protein
LLNTKGVAPEVQRATGSAENDAKPAKDTAAG